MSANQFGSRFTITSFGESHGTALGVVIDGCPAGIRWDQNLLDQQMQRRRPGKKGTEQVVSGRQEEDQPEVLSGVFEGFTLGTPIAMIVRNQDAKSEDYQDLKSQHRAGHADQAWAEKFGHRDHRGGGRSSGRETVARVMAGAVARMFLNQAFPKLQVLGYASEIGSFVLTEAERKEVAKKNPDQHQARFPSDRHTEVAEMLKKAQALGESYGGVAEVLIQNAPSSLGQPVFHKFKSDLAMAYLSVGATNGFELGEGFSSTQTPGTGFHGQDSSVYGGILGGLTTGETILTRTSFKPTSSILDVAKKGRHDPCIVTRAIPVLEAMTWLVLADHYLWTKTDRI